MGKNLNGRKDVVIVEPIPAAPRLHGASSAGGKGGAISWRRSIRVCVSGGISRGRFSGFEKKAKTRGTGKGTQSANCSCRVMLVARTLPQQPKSAICTRECPTGAECKKNLSEWIAKESRA